MPQITITDVHGRAKIVDSASQLQAELNLYELRIDELIPAIESTNDAQAEQAVAMYSKLQVALEAITAQLPSFNQQLAIERRAERKALAAQLRRRRAERRGSQP